MTASLNRRLKILTWHVHGNYLYYLSQVPHDFYLVTKPGNPPGYAGPVGALPWGGNVHAIDYNNVREGDFDCVLYQQKSNYLEDRLHALSEVQRKLPRVYIEHDPPQENPFAQRHWVQDSGLLLVHVTYFNRLMWDCGVTPTTVIEHGVVVPEGVVYDGGLAKGIVVINNLRERGRRLGFDVFDAARKVVALDLVGMDAESAGGIGEISNLELAAFCAPYRFFFNPIRWTSLGLAIVEAMMIGMPIVGLATTELASVIRNGDNGFVHNDSGELCRVMNMLLSDHATARGWGAVAQRTARQRFHIDRFVADWVRILNEVTAV
ncbi:MAG: biosynthesis transferase [Betaproteobacteria bacterium]|nr:biosynthesis transferase [Betaproteobacteria bacterium]